MSKFVGPEVVEGMTEASATRRPRTPVDSQLVVHDRIRIGADFGRANRVSEAARCGPRNVDQPSESSTTPSRSRAGMTLALATAAPHPSRADSAGKEARADLQCAPHRHRRIRPEGFARADCTNASCSRG